MATSKVPQLAVKYAEVTNKALGFAAKFAQLTQQEKKASAEKIPAVRDLLKRAGLIDEVDVKRADSQLSKHADTLDILTKVIQHYEGQMKTSRAKEASSNLGAPADDAQSLPGRDKFANQPGRRRGSTDPHAESDMALFHGLGIEPGSRE